MTASQPIIIIYNIQTFLQWNFETIYVIVLVGKTKLIVNQQIKKNPITTVFSRDGIRYIVCYGTMCKEAE